MRKLLTILVVVLGIAVIARRLMPQTGGGSGLPLAAAPFVAARQTDVYLANGVTPAYAIEAGTALRPVGGGAELDCRPVIIAGETTSVCHIEVVISERWGWVAEADIAKR